MYGSFKIIIYNDINKFNYISIYIPLTLAILTLSSIEVPIRSYLWAKSAMYKNMASVSQIAWPV